MVENLSNISNYSKVKANFDKYKGSDPVVLKRSEKADKKYKVIISPASGRSKTVHFGSKLEDYTKHQDEDRRKRYLARAKGIKGEWRNDKYSPNNLAIHLLWN
jgi:hypothetical protein